MTDYFDWKATYAEMYRHIPQPTSRPVIGITGNFGDKGCELGEGYYRSVLAAGGIPVILPPCEDPKTLRETLQHIDALLLSGGGDINPLFSGQQPSPALHSINPQRDLCELLLTRMAYDMQLPVLGICRGCQMLAAALGGFVHQDLSEAMPGQALYKHSQDAPRYCATHNVELTEGSLSHTLWETTTLAVNSFHHQAVADAGPHLKVTAVAPDGVVEGIESNEHKSIIGLQWHPECFLLHNDKSMHPVFEWLVNEARNYREAVNLHDRILTLDSHCDTPMKFHTDEERLTTLPRMCLGHLDATIMVAYLPQGKRDEETCRKVTEHTRQLLHEIEEYIATESAVMGIARSPEDLYRLKAEHKRAVMPGIENGYAIGHDLSLLQEFRQRGVVYMTLCHNGDNDICDSARGKGEHGGVSAFGKDVIREMNRLGMMVDLSHAAESSFWDALRLSETPIICSHSSCKALCDHPRNLTDEQMKALAERGGVMQVTLYEGFLRTDRKADITDAVAHINHAVSVMGIDHVGIGTDFDGDGGVPGVAHAGEIINLTRLLLQQGYTHDDLAKLWGENFLRVMKECQSHKA